MLDGTTQEDAAPDTEEGPEDVGRSSTAVAGNEDLIGEESVEGLQRAAAGTGNGPNGETDSLGPQLRG